MSNELVKSSEQALEKVMMEGDLSQLSPRERLVYYKNVCDSIGLNPLTKPFEYIRLNGKLTLYARKDATEQLRKVNKISITKIDRESLDNGIYIVTAYARTFDGREDASTGVVNISGLKGEALANAYMKAETKAKRRVTLSIGGLGWLDESEVESIKDAVIETNVYEADVKETQKKPLQLEDNVQDEIQFSMYMEKIKATSTQNELANVYQEIKDDPIKKNKMFYKPLIEAVKEHKDMLDDKLSHEVINNDINM